MTGNNRDMSDFDKTPRMIDTDTDGLDCCGAAPEDANAVPKEDLEALVADWNTREYYLGEAQKERFGELQKCRRELEDLL